MLAGIWVLDPANSKELLDRLRPHSVSPDFEVIWCGEGWRKLISDCHNELAARFPDYCFAVIKQERGVLAFQARPRAGQGSPNEEDLAEIRKLLARRRQEAGR